MNSQCNVPRGLGVWPPGGAASHTHFTHAEARGGGGGGDKGRRGGGGGGEGKGRASGRAGGGLSEATQQASWQKLQRKTEVMLVE